jgi:hypothetical protein
MSNRDQDSQLSNPALERLGMFVGEWNTEITSMSFHPDPSAIAHGHTSFDWIEGRAFLIQHSEVPNSDFPSSVSIMGTDDSADTNCMLYFDSRGVSRIYQMSLNGDVWKLWRDFPGFSQRFMGTFSKDYRVITAHWEKSSDGTNWERDFNITYTKVT